MVVPSSDSGIEGKTADSLEQVITHLFDAVRYSEQAEELQERAKALSMETADGLTRLDAFVKEIQTSAAKLTGGVEAQYSTQLSGQVLEFVKTAVEQAKSRANSELTAQVSEIDTKVASERAKAVKSLESYFITSPLPVMERVLTIKTADVGYEANISYKCQGGTKYSFALATQNSVFFHGTFNFSLFDKKLSIPVALSKTWIRREASPRYERLDRYALTWAEVADSHTIVDFTDLDGQTKIRMVSSSPDAQSLTTVEYSEGDQVTNVTTDTGLNKFVDSKAVTEALLRLRSELLALEKNKAALTELTADGEDILKSLNCEYLLSSVLRLMAQPYKTLIQGISSRPLRTQKGEISISLLRERLALLGPSSAIVKEALAIR